MYKFGTIILVPFPFTDLTATKLRPALVISQTDLKADDIIVIFITSKHPEKLRDGQFLLRSSDPHFKATGLKFDSLFRFDKIATLNKKLILGELGQVHYDHLRRMKEFFYSVFGFRSI